MSSERTIGIDLGGTTIKGGVVDSHGTIHAQHTLESLAEEGPSAVIRQIAIVIGKLLGQSKGADIVGIGVGAPGVVTLDGGLVKHPPNFAGWTEVYLGNELQKLFKLPVFVENDANVAALAEARFGAGVGVNDFLFVIWGTGVGGGIILNGEIYRGPTGAAGEIGHVTIDYNGPPCNCGNRGCVEAYVGQRYLSQRTRDRLAPLMGEWKQHRSGSPPSKIIDLVQEKLELIEPAIISRAAEQGDRFAHEVLEEAGELLGVGIASVLNVLDLQTVIIGGGVSAVNAFVFEAVERSVRSRVLKSAKEEIRIRQAKLGNTAGILGAAVLPSLREAMRHNRQAG